MLLVDEKMCPVKRKGQWLYLAVDTTGDILHCSPVSELSSTEAAKFLNEVLALGVRVKGIVTDLDPGLTRAVETVCAETPYQYCIKHALTAIGILIGYVEKNNRWQRRVRTDAETSVMETGERSGKSDVSGDGALIVQRRVDQSGVEAENSIGALYETCRLILAAPTELEARMGYETLRNNHGFPPKPHRKAVRFLTRRWEHLMMHHRIAGMPRTTNLVENVNKQLERRYKTIEAFQYRSTAVHYTNLLIAFLRQKPYTDCRGTRKYLNGKSRLGSAKIRGLHPDWMKNCLKNT